MIKFSKSELIYILQAARLPQGVLAIDDVMDGNKTESEFRKETELTYSSIEDIIRSIENKVTEELLNRKFKSQFINHET